MKFKNLFSFMCASLVFIAHADRIRLYTFYTPSHTILVRDWLLPSVLALNEYDIVIKHYPQECPSSIFMSQGWTTTTYRKIEVLIDAIRENWGSYFVYTDVDVQFFRPTLEAIDKALEEHDIVFQRDSPPGSGFPEGIICTGFIACRANEKTLALWEAAAKSMRDNKNTPCDQTALNAVIREKQFSTIRWNFLPNTFFGGGTLTGKGWNPGDTLPLSKDIKVHHANWTAGTKDKIKQLEYVKAFMAGQN